MFSSRWAVPPGRDRVRRGSELGGGACDPVTEGGAMANSMLFDDIAAERPHLLADPETHMRTIELANALAVQRGLVHVPIGVLLGDVVSLADDQTPFKGGQTTRGTCYAFAACAAMEAAYKRKYGVTLDLSEQYAFHLNMACELYTNYMTTPTQHENNSSYWGFRGSSDIVDKLARAAIPEEVAAPYLVDIAMDQLKADTPACRALNDASTQWELDAFEWLEALVPVAARHEARYRVTDYRALPSMPRIEDLEAVLADGHEIVADIQGHCFLLVGYNRRTRVFMVKNSWGEDHFIEHSYDSPNQIQGGRYVLDVDVVDAPPQKDAYWLGRWQMDHDGWHGELVIRRTTDYHHNQGELTKLGDYYKDGECHAVNGVTTEDGQGLHFWIADGTGRVQPGSELGQAFWVYVFTWDPANAAGTTLSNGSDYGVSLSRTPIPGTPSEGFDANAWLGTWDMNHDGWRGTLDIRAVQPFAAAYRPDDGGEFPVTGGPDAAQPHILRIAIPFSSENPQQFQLFGHTWENDVFSGLTEWGNQAFGVQGRHQ